VCANHCKSTFPAAVYYGVAFGNTCWCSTKGDTSRPVANPDYRTCPGDPSQNCGANLRTHVRYFRTPTSAASETETVDETTTTPEPVGESGNSDSMSGVGIAAVVIGSIACALLLVIIVLVVVKKNNGSESF